MALDRRAFLSVSVAALVAGAPGLKVVVQAAPLPAPASASQTQFYGNPNCTITALGGGIFVSRTSGQTPCFIHVSAKSITCKGTRALGTGTTVAIPYEDLEFSWSFGDSSGQEVFTRPTDGASVNANQQIGPEALYCYRNAGSYTIKLTVRGKNGSGYTTETFTQAINVSAFSASNGVRYIDSVNGNNNWLGTVPVPTPAGNPTNGPWKDLAAASLHAFLGATGKKALYIAQGSVITGPGAAPGINLGITNGTSNWRIGSYIGASGPRANPIINISSGSNNVINLGNPGANGTRDDIVVSNIVCQVSDGWIPPGGPAAIIGCFYSVSGTGTMSNIYFDNVVAETLLSSNKGPSYSNAVFQAVGGTSQWWGMWGGALTAGTIYTSGNALGQSFFGGPITQGLGFYGVTFSGTGAGVNTTHHIYPETQYHSVYKWLTFGATGTGSLQRAFCVNTNFDGPNRTGALYNAGNILMSECSFGNTSWMHDLGNAYNDPEATQYYNVVVERNAVSGLTGFGLIPFSCGVGYTFRDNRVWSCGIARLFVPDGCLAGLLTPSIYRNRIYIPSSNAAGNPVFNCINTNSPLTFNTSNTLIRTGSNGLPLLWYPPGTAVRLSSAGALPGGFSANAIYYVKNNYTVVAGVAGSTDTVTFANNNIVAPNITNKRPPNGTPVTLTNQVSLPAGFSAGTIYYIVNINPVAGTFQLSTTLGGPPIAITTSGSRVQLSVAAFTLSATKGGPEVQATSAGLGTVSCIPAWTVPWTFTDNVIWDARTSVWAIDMVFADHQAASSLFDRNQYWSAGASNLTYFFTDTGSKRSFTQWRGVQPGTYFDPNGAAAQPSWNVPPKQWSDFGA